MTHDLDTETDAGRCVILVDQNLPIGRVANAAAVIALTIGKLHPELAGADLIDKSGYAHPGLIPIGISVLGATAEEIKAARDKAATRDLSVVDFPIQGQQTNDYAAFGDAVSLMGTADLIYVGVGIYGARKLVGKIVGKFGFLK